MKIKRINVILDIIIPRNRFAKLIYIRKYYYSTLLQLFLLHIACHLVISLVSAGKIIFFIVVFSAHIQENDNVIIYLKGLNYFSS